ncbi:glycoside hydrolase family 43 protein [Reichenbachiella ulvae]|uniref:Glycoside hydrolase family 43 protein n=1 Tax=Reichenbachiella ulvae TaxID=2980104 RepID=A0ABT3D0G1_9BACT|nr:glycoside hydrolase family 43 protein [Reichenbachiella ulvae]MCV9389288.1 glycoside hydrolase family 43 protein [Reichenbachiella ulvae]
MNLCLLIWGFNSWSQELTLDEIRVRDPYIVAYEPTQTYYLYAQKQNRLDAIEDEVGVEVYRSKDLKTWVGPKSVFQAPEGFWGRQMVWAPEVHEYKGSYYLFVTFTSYDTLDTPGQSTAPQWKRGTQILRASHPEGPFELISKDSQTPPEWMCLDGSLWVEEETPYMVFCHEWAQIEDGTIDVIELSDDLAKAVSDSQVLFSATSIPWVRSLADTGYKHHGYVTDGNFIYETKNGKLIMIWSSFGPEGYALIQAVSDSGKIHGPWRQIEKPLFKAHGGHGMIFKTFEGQLMLSFHQPNSGKLERAQLFEIKDKGDHIALKDKIK